LKPLITLSLRITSLIAICVLAASWASAQVIFTDGTFNNSDWSLSYFATGTGSATQSQVLTGGNPGAYMNVVITSNNDYVLASSYMNAAQYNPQTQGAITDVSESFDNIQFAGGQGIAPAVEQNGIDYFDSAYDTSYPTLWTTFNWNDLQASSYSTSSDPNAHPDFSSSGTAVTFGFWTANAPVGDRVTSTGYDNFTVTIQGPQGTPEPGAVSLFIASAVAGRLLWRRRRR
jgi:hypothetical protein